MTPLVYDVDSHFEPAPGWFDAFPGLRGRVPDLLPQDDPEFALASAEHFAGIDAATWDSFVGGSMAEAYARMGDPLEAGHLG